MVLRLPSLDATKPAGMAKIKNARENEVSTIEDVPGSMPSTCWPYKEKKVSTALKPVNQKNIARSIKIRLLFLATSFFVFFSSLFPGLFWYPVYLLLPIFMDMKGYINFIDNFLDYMN